MATAIVPAPTRKRKQTMPTSQNQISLANAQRQALESSTHLAASSRGSTSSQTLPVVHNNLANSGNEERSDAGRSHQATLPRSNLSRLNNLSICISSVKFFCSDLSTEVITDIATNMVNLGEKVTSETLLQQCELLSSASNVPGRNSIHEASTDSNFGSPSIPLTNATFRERRQSQNNYDESFDEVDSAICVDGDRNEHSNLPVMPGTGELKKNHEYTSFDERPQTATLTTSGPSYSQPSDASSRKNQSTNQNSAVQSNTVYSYNHTTNARSDETINVLEVSTNNFVLPISHGAASLASEANVLVNMVSGNTASLAEALESSYIKSSDVPMYSLYLVQKENEMLKDSRQCSQCHIKPRDVTFLPCGHFCACRECAIPIYVCPMCTKNVLATVDTYLS